MRRFWIVIGTVTFVASLAFGYAESSGTHRLACSGGFATEAGRIDVVGGVYYWSREVNGRKHELRYVINTGELCTVTKVQE